MSRHEKEVFESEDDKLAYLFAKLYDVRINENGETEYVRTGNCLTLEEMAYVSWLQDGRPAKGPISKMGQLKREAKILEKVKFKLLKSGMSLEELHDLMVMLSKADRRPAQCCDRVEEIEY